MNFTDDDDSVFEQALRADLPSMSEQNRMRQRLLAAGIAAGTALGSTNVAAATQASFGASALSKLSALSWPAKLGLAAALAAPVAVLPAAYPPAVRAAELVSHVQSSAATVHARALAKTSVATRLQPSDAPPSGVPSEPPDVSVTPAAPLATSPARAVALSAGALPSQPAPSLASDGSAENAGPASAAPVASNGPANDALPPRTASTLAAETQLLDRAFAALAAGDRRTASALVAEHARLFPNGLLQQERERARARLTANSTGE